ncbi:hypothetical protein EYZ11_012708 [Aspergillus tanneri]|uniref:Cytochrome b5 heme-binding domain-containing protein n=1 Tax=Aspergillus tanneri TaxID=1220188 RepID=A0A4S3IZJ1_9EURO|nr:hypothetical protein EYZ11_012708 [Aspergillus tanneri]
MVDKGESELAQQITLSVAVPGGQCVRFLRDSQIGQMIKMRVSPAPHFWAPAESEVPLLLLAQGAGVGPFLGFLNGRQQRASPDAGRVILILSARTIDDVPYLPELKALSKTLPLTAYLALSCGKCQFLERGNMTQRPEIMKAQDLILTLRQEIKALLKGNGHAYVCGGLDFGCSIRRAMPVEPKQRFTFLDLSQHNEISSLWIALNGIVYDVTQFGDVHPGGIKALVEVAGTEADDRFEQAHSGSGAQGRLAQYAIGTLQGGDLSPNHGKVLREIVLCQNALTNSTLFAPSRQVPFFVFSASLLVTWNRLKGILHTVRTAPQLLRIPEHMDQTLKQLRAESWRYLSVSTKATLAFREKKIRLIYSSHWNQFHCLFHGMKNSFRPEGDYLFSLLNSSVLSIYRSVKRSTNALRRGLGQDMGPNAVGQNIKRIQGLENSNLRARDLEGSAINS